MHMMACSSNSSVLLLPKCSVTMNVLMTTCVAALVVAGAVLPAVVAAGDADAAAGGSGPTLHHLHLYMHENDAAGPNSTAVAVVKCTGPRLLSLPSYCFGDAKVVDDELTAAPPNRTSSSPVVGRVQGLHVVGSREELVFVMSLTIVLTDYPPYAAGSTLAVLARNDALAPVRELPVVGGTGSFRMATGYVLLKTKSWSSDLHDAVLELDIFVRTV